MLALTPDTVRTERIVTGTTTPLGELWERLTAGGVAAVSPSGVMGDPTGATAAEGMALLGTWTSSLRAAVAQWVREVVRTE